jgi:hypothetical protein
VAADRAVAVRGQRLSDDELISSIELAFAVESDVEPHVPVQYQMHTLARGVLDLFDRLLELHGVRGLRQ